MLDLGHEKVVACDTTFGTNNKKVLSSISLQCLIFSRSTWSSQLMNILLVIVSILYVHSFLANGKMEFLWPRSYLFGARVWRLNNG
jgi:hypothetical protein